MKSLLRALIYNIFCLYLSTLLIPGFKIAGGAHFVVFAAACFTALNFFLKPVLKIMFFPINLLTLGIFSWVINVIIIYTLIYFIPQIKITDWTFAGFHFQGFAIPAIYFTKFFTIILSSFIISCTMSLLNWIRK